MAEVVVQNASTEPLHVVPVGRAVMLLLREKATLVEADEVRQLRSERLALPYPRVIRLAEYVRVPYRPARFASRRGILRRDEHTCQYCGAHGVPMTVDHVVPRARGGATTWENCVAACAACNRRKGGRLPQEAGLSLRRRPGPPISVIANGGARAAAP